MRKESRAKRNKVLSPCSCLMWRLCTPYQLRVMGNLNETVTSKRSQEPLHILGRGSASQATNVVWGLQSSWSDCVYEIVRNNAFGDMTWSTVVSIQSRIVPQLTFNSLLKGWVFYAEWSVKYLVPYFLPPTEWILTVWILISGQFTADRQLYPDHRFHEFKEVMY